MVEAIKACYSRRVLAIAGYRFVGSCQLLKICKFPIPGPSAQCVLTSLNRLGFCRHKVDKTGRLEISPLCYGQPDGQTPKTTGYSLFNLLK